MWKIYLVQMWKKLTINAIIMATKEVIYRKRQGIGFPYIIHVKRILFDQMIQERTSIMTGAEEVSFSLKWDPIEQELLIS